MNFEARPKFPFQPPRIPNDQAAKLDLNTASNSGVGKDHNCELGSAAASCFTQMFEWQALRIDSLQKLLADEIQFSRQKQAENEALKEELAELRHSNTIGKLESKIKSVRSRVSYFKKFHKCIRTAGHKWARLKSLKLQQRGALLTQDTNQGLHKRPKTSANRKSIHEDDTELIKNVPCSVIKASLGDGFEVDELSSSEVQPLPPKPDFKSFATTDQDFIQASGLLWLAENNQVLEGTDRWGNKVTFANFGEHKLVKTTANRWAKCRFCKTSMQVLRVVCRFNFQIIFAVCECSEKSWAHVIRRGSITGSLSEPFNHMLHWESQSTNCYLNQVWTNDCILAYTTKSSRKLTAYKWSSIIEGNFEALDLRGCPQLEKGDVASCILDDFVISVLWIDGGYLLPQISGYFKGRRD